MTATTTHTIELSEMRPGRWQSSCSCGHYKSSGYTIPGQAKDAHASHVRSKTRGAA
jgi:hypothetical protein